MELHEAVKDLILATMRVEKEAWMREMRDEAATICETMKVRWRLEFLRDIDAKITARLAEEKMRAKLDAYFENSEGD